MHRLTARRWTWHDCIVALTLDLHESLVAAPGSKTLPTLALPYTPCTSMPSALPWSASSCQRGTSLSHS